MATAETASVIEKRSTLKALASTLAKLSKGVELSMVDVRNYANVRTLKDELNECWSLYENENSNHDLLSSEEQTDIKRTFEILRVEFESLIRRIESWIVETEGKQSSVGSKSRTSSQRKRHLAELKLTQVQKRQDLERRQQDLQSQQDELKRELELQTIKNELARSELLEDNSDSSSSTSSEYNSVSVHGLPKTAINPVEKVQEYVRNLSEGPIGVRQTKLSADAVPFERKTDRDTELFDGLKAMTLSVQESLNLPKPELLTFSGNPVDYCKFVSNFDTNIESRIKDSRLRLSYLIQYCHGDARRSIEDCVVLPSDEGYVRAKQILLTRYGKPHLVARSHVERLINGSSIRSNDIQGLMNLSLDMEKCQITLSQVGFVSDINNTENLRKIVRRLPTHVRSKWVERASQLIEQGSEPNFNDLLSFVKERALVANTMYGQDLASESKTSQITKMKSTAKVANSREKVVTLSTNGSTCSRFHGNELSHRQSTLSCVYCKEGHKLIECGKFKLIDIGSKLGIIKRHKMCENCLNFKHFAKYCRKPSCCEVTGCSEKHHTMLHSEVSQDGNDNSGQSNCCAASERNFTQNKVSLRIVPVVVQNGLTHVKTYALLDEGSDITLCSDELVKKLGATGTPREFTITTVNQSTERKHGLELQLKVSSLDENETVALNRVWSVKRLPISLKSLPNRSEIGKWSHLAGITLPRINACQVELLIGSDTPEAFWVEDERRGNKGEPYAIRSILGWSIIGPTGKTVSPADVNVNYQQTSCVQQQSDRLWKTDFPDCRSDNSTGMSQEDRTLQIKSAMEGPGRMSAK